MTTDTTPGPRQWGMAALVRATMATVAAGILGIVLAAAIGGSAAAFGAMIGAVLVVAVFAFGAFTVNAVAGALPSAALLVALLTYTLQVIVMALAFVAISDSGLLDETVSRSWLGGSVIVGTMVWMTVQVLVSTSRRIPIYDLPEQSLQGATTQRCEGAER